MNGLKPTGGWMGTLGEGEPNTVGRAELMACVEAAGSTRGNLDYVTDFEILKKREDRGWLHHDLGKVATLTSGGECLEPCKRGREHSRCSGSVRTLTLPISSLRITHMALVFGNEMADAMAKQAANEAALRGAAAERVAWVDALTWQVQKTDHRGKCCKRPQPIPLSWILRLKGFQGGGGESVQNRFAGVFLNR